MNNMKRIITNILLIFICFLLQSTFSGMFRISNIMPNILLLLTAACGFMQGDRTGVFVGFICGFLLDIFSFEIVGFYALLYMFIGYLNGQFHNTFYPEDIKLPLLLFSFSDLFYSLINYVFLFLLRSRFHFGFYFLNICLPELAYTIFVAILFYPALLLLEHFLFRVREKKENA